MKKIFILQPSYFPWLGFFEMLDRCDTWVVYDDVQYTKRDWRNRNKIKTQQGPLWLTVPVKVKGRFDQNINEVEIDNEQDWNLKHGKTIAASYSKAPQFKTFSPRILSVLEKRWEKLSDLNVELVRAVADHLKLQKEIILSSSLGTTSEDRTERILEICEKLKATHYYNGAAGREIYSPDVFRKRGIELEFQDYTHPVYPQLWGDFEPYLSCIDLLLNCSSEEAMNIIRSGVKL